MTTVIQKSYSNGYKSLEIASKTHYCGGNTSTKKYSGPATGSRQVGNLRREYLGGTRACSVRIVYAIVRSHA